ncbi:MAG: zf-HC2 domain-containing protein [Dorea sp.]|jgi:predicted anti-sigma-YlaC factor YlaD|nr:zf-HC2 domain-containing protein [Dorea sp.]
MKCEIIRDLMPLYLDDCCSEGSGRLVKEHIEECDSCRNLLEEMSKELVVGTREKQKNLMEEELLKTGKEVIKTEMRRDYLEKIVWIDIPLNIVLYIFGMIIMLRYNGSNFYLYEKLSKMMWEKSVSLDIYSSIGDPMTVGLMIYFLVGEILYLVRRKKKRQIGMLDSIIWESVIYKIIMFLTLAVIGLLLMMQK